MVLMLCFLTLVFTGASLFIPSFLRDGVAMVGVIGGFFVAPIAAYLAALATREIRESMKNGDDGEA